VIIPFPLLLLLNSSHGIFRLRLGGMHDRRSMSRYCTFLVRNLLSWSSKKKTTVSWSSTESEYKALTNASTELIWIHSLLCELGTQLPHALVLDYDNIGATYLTLNPIFHARTKYIAIDYHFIRDMMAAKELDVRIISEKDQLADILTKPLVSQKLLLLKSNLNLNSPMLSLKGRLRSNSNQEQESNLFISNSNQE